MNLDKEKLERLRREELEYKRTGREPEDKRNNHACWDIFPSLDRLLRGNGPF